MRKFKRNGYSTPAGCSWFTNRAFVHCPRKRLVRYAGAHDRFRTTLPDELIVKELRIPRSLRRSARLKVQRRI
jgi:hypothetical protein